MTVRIESSVNSLPYDNASLSINNLPMEIIRSIIGHLDFNAYLSSRLVCHHWKIIGKQLDYDKFIEEIGSVNKLSFLEPKHSGWENIPHDWTGENFNELKLSSYSSSDSIIIHPPVGRHSSKFISSNAMTPSSFLDGYFFMSKYNDTYFLTDKMGNKLIIKSFLDSSKDKEIDFVFGQRQHFFPISESCVVNVTFAGEVLYWDFSDTTPNRNSILKIDELEVFRVGNYLILNKKIINLITLSISEHEFTFNNETIKGCDSGFCTYNKNEKRLRYFSISSSSLLNEQWALSNDHLLENFDRQDDLISDLSIEYMTAKYIVLKYCQPTAIHLLILNLEGEVIHKIDCKLGACGYINPHSWPNDFQLFLHVYENILVFKKPQRFASIIYLWHLPTKRLIRELETQEQYLGPPNASIQDIRLHKDTFTILLSSYSNRDYKHNDKFCVIQSQCETLNHIQLSIHSICSFCLKQLGFVLEALF